MAALTGMRDAFADFRRWRWSGLLIAAVVFTVAWFLPYLYGPLDSTLDTAIYAVAYIVFALGLNIVVGFAGLLDLGYVAFYAIGAYSIGWFGSDWFTEAINGGKSGVHVGVSGQAAHLLGIHLNFVLIVVAAMIFTSIAGAFIGTYSLAINSNQFQFSFSIFVLAMIIVGGLGSIWGTVAGAIILSVINQQLIPTTFHTAPHDLFALNFTSSEISFGIFGFLLVLMMVARPQGLIPERRRKLELTEGLGSDESLYEVSA